MSKCFMQLRKRVILGLLVLSLAIGVLAGCSGNDSNDGNFSAAKAVSLNGAWGGSLVEGGTANPVQLSCTIAQETGSEDFSGSMTINGEDYTLKGTIVNKVIQIIMSNSQSSITWNGEYIDGRLKGAFTCSTNATNKAVSMVTSTGTITAMQYVQTNADTKMGPWLLYSQDNIKFTGNMTIRLAYSGSKKDVITATVTNSATNKVISQPMVRIDDKVFDGLYEYTFTGLPSNSYFNYTITYSNPKSDPKVKPITASFRTPPSWDDLNKKRVSKQVFFGMGDNRRDSDPFKDGLGYTDYLPMVENNMIQTGGIADSSDAQTCIIHAGDSVNLGKHLDYVAPIGLHHYGWEIEWLKSSNDTAKTDKYGHDYSPHTWMRASMPTFMAPGNHEGSDVIVGLAGAINKGDLDYYGKFMTKIPDKDKIKLANGQDSLTYMADYGGIRIISLNVYYCDPDTTDLTKIQEKITGWVEGAYPKGPIVVVLHPSPYGSSYQSANGNGSACFNDMQNLRDRFKTLFGGRKNVIVISGHVHETARTLQDGINYYVLGTSGAADMNYGDKNPDAVDNSLQHLYDVGAFVKLLKFTGNVYLDFAFGKFTVDYETNEIKAEIIGANDYDLGDRVKDVNTWKYLDLPK